MSDEKPELLGEMKSRPPGGAEAAVDLTGRDRLISNVLFNWGAHTVFIAAGFVVPRLIDRHLGQQLLGVWDFSWSLVNHFQLVQIGVTSSVNRYVARYWATSDVPGISRIVSSASFVLGIAGLIVMGLTATATLLLPYLFGGRLGENVHEAQWVVFFLGASLAIQITFSGFSGVLTGCHRWGLHNINTSGWYAATVTGMMIALLLGGRLWMLAVITLAGEVLTDARRVMLAHRVCKGLRLRPSLVRRPVIRELILYGTKTLIPSVSRLLLNQTTSILIIAYLGPAALALYSRPQSLMYQIEVLVRKMAMTLVPTISSLERMGSLPEIRDLVIKSVRYSFYMALPMVLVLVVFGGALMQLWMGPRYADGLVPAILAIGNLAVLSQWPALSILAGLNAHGRAGVARLIGSLCSVALNVLVLAYLKWGLVGTAVAVTLPLTLVNVVDIPLLVCRRVDLDAKRYFLSVVIRPMIHVLPFAVCLVGARLAFRTEPLIGLVLGGAVGGVILGVVYWRYVLPESVRLGIARLLKNGGAKWRAIHP